MTGCSAQANLIVTTNQKVEENIEVYNSFENLKDSYASIEAAKENYILSYQDFFTNSKYKATYTTKDNLLKAKIKGFHNNLRTISSSNLYLMLFEPILLNNDQYVLSCKEDAIDLFEDTLGVGADSSYFLDEFILNIQFHNVVENNNSDSYDARTNTYTWIITKDNLMRDIEFTITNEKRYDIIMAYLFKKYIDYILLGVLLIVIVIFGILIVRKSKRENAI